MKKRWVRVFSMALFISALMIQAGRDGKLNGNIQEESAGTEEQNLGGETEETEPEYVFEGYRALDVNLFESESLNQVIVDRAAKDTGEGKEEFVPVICENSSFPEGLVVKVEEALHQIPYSLSNIGWDFEIEMEEEIRERLRGDTVSHGMYKEFGLHDFRLTIDFEERDKRLEELGKLFPKADPVYYKYDGETSGRDTYEWIFSILIVKKCCSSRWRS